MNERLRQLQAQNNAVRCRMDSMRQRFDRLRDRHLNGTAPVAVNAYNLFQTPVDLAERMAGMLGLEPGMTVLEPSAGLGRLIRPCLRTEGISVTAVEIAPQCAEILYEDFPGVELLQGDFLEREFADGFDRVIMNPPFHMRSDIRHILRARQWLKPGGKLVALCMAGPGRERELRPLADSWDPLPPKSFKRKGTGIDAVLLTLHN